MTRNELRRLKIRAVFSASTETFHHPKRNKLMLLEYLLLGKTVNLNKGSMKIIKVEAYDESADIVNLYWDKRVNTTRLCINDDYYLRYSCEALSLGLFKLEFTETGMQGQNYSNFDVRWTT